MTERLKRGSHLRRILSNICWMLFDKVFILFINLVVTVRIANYYGSQGYGVYQYAVSIVAVFEILVCFVDARVVKKRYISENAGELVWNATITRLLFSVLSLIAGIIYLCFCKESNEYYVIFLVLLVNAVIINLRFGMWNRYEYLLKSKKIVVAANIALALGGGLQLVAVSLHLSIIAIAVITAISSFVSLVIVYFQYRKDYGRLIQGKFNKSLVEGLIRESLPLAVAASCAIIYSRCDSIMIGNMMTKEQVGIYAIAVKLISLVQIALVPIRESVFPKLVETYKKDHRLYEQMYIQITAILTWVYVAIVVLSFLLFPIAIRILKPEYADAYPVFQIYVIGTFFMYNAGLRAGHYTLINRGSVLMYSQIVSVFFNIVLNYILIKQFGVFGAAVATGITQCISLMISNLFFGKQGKQVFIWQLKSLNPWYILSDRHILFRHKSK